LEGPALPPQPVPGIGDIAPRLLRVVRAVMQRGSPPACRWTNRGARTPVPVTQS
jgi:hypothetical protein